jgi:hypothetical protein
MAIPCPLERWGGLVASDPCLSYITICGFRVYYPMLIPLCLMAAMIGIRGAKAIAMTGAKGYKTYSHAFGMYAVMMTCSGLAHCIVPSSTSAVFNFVVTYLDLALTSSIAFHFGLAALADLGMDENGKMMSFLTTFGEVLIFGLWYYFGYLHPTGYAFWYLYVGLIVICCGFWVLAQAVMLLRNGLRGMMWFTTAAAAGGIGLWCALNRGIMCARFGANFGASFWWDALSNLAMIALAGYFFTSRDIPAATPTDDQEDLELGHEDDEQDHSDLPPAYQHAASPAAHPQIVYIPLQMYPSPHEEL